MEDAGATIVHVEIPNRTGILGNATSVFLREWAFATEDYFAARTHAPISSLDDVLASGEYLSETRQQLQRAVGVTTLDTAEYRNAVAARGNAAAAVTALLEEHDLDALAYPSVQNTAAANGVQQQGNNCATASVSGLPAMSVPAGLDSTGMPVGLDLLGRAFDEGTLIRLASGYEAAVDPRVEPPLTP
jgi:Asp-tRNA(Asn)/Glu-tRNA(Gln) amidotransferase A subunit family amidase